MCNLNFNIFVKQLEVELYKVNHDGMIGGGVIENILNLKHFE